MEPLQMDSSLDEAKGGPSSWMVSFLVDTAHWCARRMPWNDGSRGWNDVSTSQGMLRIVTSHQKPGRGQRFSLQMFWKEHRPADILVFGPWASRTRENLDREAEAGGKCCFKNIPRLICERGTMLKAMNSVHVLLNGGIRWRLSCFHLA